MSINDKLKRRITYDELLTFIEYLEKKYPVDTWIVNDVRVWPILRKQIFQWYYQEYIVSETLLRKIKNRINDVVNIVKLWFVEDNNKLENVQVVILSNNLTRNLLVNGKCFNCNTDWFVEKLEEQDVKYYQYEIFNFSDIKLPRYSLSLNFNWLYFKALVKTKCTLKKISNIQMDQYCNFKHECIDMNIPSIIFQIDRLADKVLFEKKLSNYIANDIKRLGAKIGLLEEWYSYSGMAFCMACHSLNIPCYDIQHGCAGASKHPFYYSWNKIPYNGYEFMPSGFWCWDENDAQAIMTWKFSGQKPDIIVGGRPIRKIIDKESERFLSKNNMKILEKIKRSDKIKILVSLTTVYSIPQWCIDFIKASNKYLWIVREHPCFDYCQKKIIEQLCNLDHIIIDERKFSIPLELELCHVDCHVTMNSSVIIDAMSAGVHSIMLDELSADRYDYVCKKGYCVLAHNENELVALLQRFHRKNNECLISDTISDGAFQKLLKIINGGSYAK